MTVREQKLTEKPRTLRVRVVDKTKEGEPVVIIETPIPVVKFGMKMAKAFSPQMKDVDVDWDAIADMIGAGDVGKLVEVDDQLQHKTVEVWVE